MRLVGFLKLRFAGSGGEGNDGVSGTGRVFAGGACRFRGCNFGKRFRRSGIPAAGDPFSIAGISVLEGILVVVAGMFRGR